MIADLNDMYYLIIAVAVISIISISIITAFFFNCTDTDNTTSQDIHIARKIQHMMTAVGILFLNEVLSREVGLIALSIGVLFLVVIEGFRFRCPKLNALFIKTIGSLMREEEKTSKYGGSLYFLSGIDVVKIIFPNEITSLSILILGFGDPSASFFGILFPNARKIFKEKSVSGMLGCIATCFMVTIAYFYMKFNKWMLLPSIIAGIIGSVSDILSAATPVNDNFTIPIIAGGILFAVKSAMSEIYNRKMLF